MSPLTEGVTEMPEIFAFETSGEAYDASQTNDAISDGDILLVPSEGSAAILVSAWPAQAAGLDSDESAFHKCAEGVTMETIDGGKYAVAAAIAKQLVTAEGVLTEDGKAAVAASEARDEADYRAYLASLVVHEAGEHVYARCGHRFDSGAYDCPDCGH